MIFDFEKYKLNENIKQAKEYLTSKEISIEGNEVLATLSHALRKKPNFIAKFVKFHYEENIPLERLTGFITYMTTNKATIDKLPKSLMDYDTFEHIEDDLRVVEREVKANKLYSYLHPNLREQISKLVDTNSNAKADLDNLIIDYLDLSDEKKKLFTPMKFYRENKTSVMDFFDAIKYFVENLDSGRTQIEEVLKKHEGKYEIVYDENNILIVKSNDKDLVVNIGSQKWCIVYASDTYYYTYLAPEKETEHYTIFNFNYALSNRFGRFGVTINDENKPLRGGCQDNTNDEMTISSIEDTLGMESGKLKTILTNKIAVVKEQIAEAIKTASDKEQANAEDVLNVFKLMKDNNITNLNRIQGNHYTLLLNLCDNMGEGFILDNLGNPDMISYMKSYPSFLVEPFNKVIPTEFYVEHLYSYIVLNIGKINIVSWEVFLECLEKHFESGVGAADYDSIDDYIINNFSDISSSYGDNNDFIEYLCSLNIEDLFDDDVFFDNSNNRELFAKYVSTTEFKPMNTLQYIILYKEGVYGISDIASELDIMISENEEGKKDYIIKYKGDRDELADYYKDIDNFHEIYDRFDGWFPDVSLSNETFNFSFDNLKRIVNYLVKCGYDFDTTVFERFEFEEKEEYSYQYFKSLCREHEDLRFINDKVIEIIEGSYDTSEGEEDVESIDELETALERAYSDAYRIAATGEAYDAYMEKLSDLGFELWENGNYFKEENGFCYVKVDLSMIGNLDMDELGSLTYYCGDEFDYKDLIGFYLDSEGELEVDEPYYGWLGNLDYSDVNEYLSDAISDELNERKVIKFKNFIKLK